MPNFLIIGAAKAGTTSLHDWLSQHPQIYMSSIKELNFFAFEGEDLEVLEGKINKDYLAGFKTTIQDYCEQFQGVTNEIAIGESSPTYLYHPKAPERIQQYIPDVKLIAILRNPVERAYSNFLHTIRDGIEPFPDFAQALEAEENRIRERWWLGFYYKHTGFYYTQLKRYFDRFDSNQVRVYLYEDLVNDSTGMLKDIFQFLGVDEMFTPNTSIRYNVTGVPKNKLLHQFLSKPNWLKIPFKLVFPLELRKRIVISMKNRNIIKPQLPLALRRQLINIYREDILKLQDLIERDLVTWLE